jgi:hypothetical protein
MKPRTRLIVLILTVVVVFTTAGVYVVHLRSADAAAQAGATTIATLAPAAVLAGPHIVFRSAALGPSYGQLGIVPLNDPNGPRALVDISCERVYATVRAGVCITAKRGVVQTYAVATLDSQLHREASEPLNGLPSRARMSADGSMIATTTFITGHSYAQTSFSTDTVVRRDGRPLGNLESFKTFVDGHELKTVDRNFWGVTFAADNDTFYATAASGGTTWLMRGSFGARRMDSVRTDAECPSLSPDGTRIAYKKRLGSSKPGVWRLAVLELATGHETLLAETRSVDDQVEWLDTDHVLYAMSRQGSEGTVSDVWGVPADGTGRPQVLISQASSPAVVRL